MKLSIFLLMFAFFKSCYTQTLYGMTFGKGPYNQNTRDGCPEDAMRCDDKCVFESDHWTKPCLVKAPWAPCLTFQYPFYCPALKTCLSVLDQCEGKCAEQEAYINPYSDYPKSYKCGDKCANIHVPCNGSCAHPPEIKKYDFNLYKLDYACGEMCLGKPTAEGAKLCDGTCVKSSVTCDGVEEKIEGIEEEKEDYDYGQSQSKYCRGMIDCTTCAPYSGFACKSGDECQPEKDVCNGRNDCDDGSDEENCNCINMVNNCTSCNPYLGDDAYQCKSEKKCIGSNMICNGDTDCKGGDDETCIDDNGNYCEEGMRRCDNKWLCNKELCYEDDDEEDYADDEEGNEEGYGQTGPCGSSWYECNSKCIREEESCNGKCKDRKHFCDGKCLEWYEQCHGVCPIENFDTACTNSTECIRSWAACNEDDDCENGSDEWEENCKCPGMWKCEKCIKEGETFACKDSKKCIEPQQLCDGIQNCEDNSDENDCEFDGECPGLYRCMGSLETVICKNELCHGEDGDYCPEQICGEKCIRKDSACEGKCLDGEGNEAWDRKYCPASNKCITDEEQCGGKCLTEGHTPCGDGCEEEWSNYWDCNGVCINQRERCNGTCAPGKNKCGDECRESYENVWDCNGECIDDKRSCNGECKPGGNYNIVCGEHCIYYEDEGRTCDGKCVKATELLKSYKGNSKWNPPCGKECKFGFKCKDGSTCLKLGSECDGMKDCPDGSDEDAAFCKECHKYERGSCSTDEGNKNDYHCLTEPCGYIGCSDSKNYHKCGDRCIFNSEFCQETNSCNRDDFHCGDDTCIESSLRCNEASDCKSGVDEESCPDCSERHGVWQCGKTMQCRDTPCV